MKAPETRRGFTGWKLTKRPHALPGMMPTTQELRQEVHSPHKKEPRGATPPKKKSPSKSSVKKLLRKYKRMSAAAATTSRIPDSTNQNETACFVNQKDSLPGMAQPGMAPPGMTFYPSGQDAQ